MINSGFKTQKRKAKKKKSKYRKLDGRKSRTINHRLKSAKRSTETQDISIASQKGRSSVLRYTTNPEPLGLLGAKVQPMKVVQREAAPRKSASHRTFHSAGRPSVTLRNNTLRLPDRAKTHLAVSPSKTPSVRQTMPPAVAAPALTPWVSGDVPTAEESPRKPVREQTLGIPPVKTASQSLRFSHSPRFSQAPRASQLPCRVSQELRKLTKVYLSEKQSGKLQELGMDIPCAPPAIPAPEMYEKYEYVPSMGDIRVSTLC